MPSVSEKQRRFMAAAAHNPEFAKKAGIPQHVARDFNDHDVGRTQRRYKRKKKDGNRS